MILIISIILTVIYLHRWQRPGHKRIASWVYPPSWFCQRCHLWVVMTVPATRITFSTFFSHLPSQGFYLASRARSSVIMWPMFGALVTSFRLVRFTHLWRLWDVDETSDRYRTDLWALIIMLHIISERVPCLQSITFVMSLSSNQVHHDLMPFPLSEWNCGKAPQFWMKLRQYLQHSRFFTGKMINVVSLSLGREYIFF